jgi:hypothetical protein
VGHNHIGGADLSSAGAGLGGKSRQNATDLHTSRPQGSEDAEEKTGAEEKAKIALVPAEAGTQSGFPLARE